MVYKAEASAGVRLGLRWGVSVSVSCVPSRRASRLAAASGLRAVRSAPRLVLAAAAAVPWSSSSALAASRDAPGLDASSPAEALLIGEDRKSWANQRSVTASGTYRAPALDFGRSDAPSLAYLLKSLSPMLGDC